MNKYNFLLIAFLFLVSTAFANLKIPMFNTQTGKSVGYVLAKDSKYGLILTPHLHNLQPGIHGFHVHTNPSCANNGKAAGGHFDPNQSNRHLGPYNNHGHLGDLPVLIVNQQETATIPVLAPKLTVSKIKDHALMIHAGGDNYSDYPKKLGGGGDRIACGVIQK